MPTPKVCFTPSHYKGLIYLAEVSPIKKQLEVLNPESGLYRTLPLELHHPLYGSVSFIHNDQLFIIHYNPNSGTWPLSSQQTQLDKLHLTCSKENLIYPYTNGSPLQIKDCVFWVNDNLELFKLNLTAFTIEICYDWETVSQN